ncbi:leucine-rich repeat protein [Metamycoplasma hyosynoviae]|uniref:leucine-rich repeat protein n=1 Tax=Metamycoplasma hyosynoviae TaxID=29559 RepID=UPI00235EA965|nr:leucine-rich repeat protein [Metamycoplasma hyosynoviae]MDD1371837.1 leucine-rich repeat protein [Metamycoplasma hyosynoviae]
MKEQEQKNLNIQEQLPQQNQDKVKSQTPKNKVIIWSAAGAAAAALSSVASLTTVFSNQRKVSFLDKVLQSIKIDVKDKETKTRDDIKTIADFASSNLDTKLYELVVEEVDGEVNKQPLDKDKPYTTFRTKFALRNKITKAQSNFKIFDFKDVRPPKEKQQLNDLGKISEKEEDRFNDKVQIVFINNFNRGQHLASEVAKKENGEFKHFRIFLKQDNNDALQYEIKNVNVQTDDNNAEATFSYQLKVKSIDDEKFISDKLEIKFKDFAIPSTLLTEYLNSLEFKYKDAENTYIQDANKEGIIEGTPLKNSNYILEFEKFEKNLDTVQAIVKIVDRNTKETSQTRQIDMAGFFNYKKIVADAASKITFDYTDKQNTFANSLNKIFLTNTLSLQAHHGNLEVVYTGRELQQEDENDPAKRTNVVVSYVIRDKKTQHQSEPKTYIIKDFKNYLIKSELDTYIDSVENPLAVASAATKEASSINNFSQLTSQLDNSYVVDPTSVEISYPTDLVSIKVSFRIKEKNGRSDISSKQVQKIIPGFKMPQKLIEDLAQKVSFDVSGKNTKIAYEIWDQFSKIDQKTIDSRCAFVESSIKVKQTDKDKITVTYKIKDKVNGTTSQEYSKVISGFQVSDQNESKFLYDVIERDGHKVAVLTKRKENLVFKVPAKIGCYKVIKANTLYVNETFDRNYFVEVEDGIEEIERLIINTYDEKYAQILGVKLPKSIKKIDTLIDGESGDLYCISLYDNIKEINNLFSSYCNTIKSDVIYESKKHKVVSGYYHGISKEAWPSFDINQQTGSITLKGSFRFILNEAGGSNTKTLRYTQDKIHHKYYLESNDENKLYKFHDVEETNGEFSDNLKYTHIGKNAFTGNKLTKFTLQSNTLTKLDDYLFDSTNSALKEVDLRNFQRDNFNFQMIADANNIETLRLPDFRSDNGINEIDYTFANWNGIKNLYLPKNVRKISRQLVTGSANSIKHINFNELTKLEHLGTGDVNTSKAIFGSILGMETIDLSQTKLKTICRQAFWWPQFKKIILPQTVEQIGPFFMFGSEKNGNYNAIYSNEPTQQAIVQIFLSGITLEVRGHSQKPSGWNQYWVGQHWTSSIQTGVYPNELKIEWKP